MQSMVGKSFVRVDRVRSCESDLFLSDYWNSFVGNIAWKQDTGSSVLFPLSLHSALTREIAHAKQSRLPSD